MQTSRGEGYLPTYFMPGYDSHDANLATWVKASRVKVRLRVVCKQVLKKAA